MDREYIFTVEVVKPGVLLFNFISMVDKDQNLQAKQIRLTLENRKIPGKFFIIDTGDPKEPVTRPFAPDAAEVLLRSPIARRIC